MPHLLGLNLYMYPHTQVSVFIMSLILYFYKVASECVVQPYHKALQPCHQVSPPYATGHTCPPAVLDFMYIYIDM